MVQLNLLARKLYSTVLGYRRRTRSGKNQNPYEGNIFDRFDGIDFLFPKCTDCNVLDFGCCDGMISYEFARHGAKLIHGLDYDRPRIDFANKLFENVPVESAFVYADLAISADRLESKYSGILLGKYDIVLFLGVFHHLVNQMPLSELHDLVNHLLDKTDKWFAVRTNSLPEFEKWILDYGFRLIHENNSTVKGVGLLKIYERSK